MRIVGFSLRRILNITLPSALFVISNCAYCATSPSVTYCTWIEFELATGWAKLLLFYTREVFQYLKEIPV